MLLALMTLLAQANASQDCDPLYGNCEQDSAAKAKTDYPPYYGPKQVIAVLPFENKVRGVYGGWNLGEGITAMLVTELLKSNRYVLVEREAIRAIIEEQELGMTGLVREETAVKTERLSGAQFMIKGVITEFNDQAGGGGLIVGYSGFDVGGKTRTAYVGIDVRILDNLTGQIFASYNAHATARSTGASLAAKFSHAGERFKIGTSGFKSTALGQATREAVQKVIGFIVKESQHIPWEGSVIKAGRKKVYINRGKNANLKVGDRLIVYYKGEPLIDPETGFNLGSEEERLCQLTVTKVQAKFSIARRESDCRNEVIDRGYLVRFN